MKPCTPTSVAAQTRPSPQCVRRRAKPLVGTLVDISVNLADGNEDAENAHVDRAINAAFAEISEIHRLMSFHDPHSDLGRINRAAINIPVELDARTAEVLRAAQRAAAESGGAFDCTVAHELVCAGLLPAPMPVHAPAHALAAQEPCHAPLWALHGNQCIKQAPCLILISAVSLKVLCSRSRHRSIAAAWRSHSRGQRRWRFAPHRRFR